MKKLILISLLISISFLAFSQKTQFEVGKVSNDIKPVQSICYFNGIDTAQGWVVYSIDVLGSISSYVISDTGTVVPNAIQLNSNCCNTKNVVDVKVNSICFMYQDSLYQGYETVLFLRRRFL